MAGTGVGPILRAEFDGRLGGGGALALRGTAPPLLQP